MKKTLTLLTLLAALVLPASAQFHLVILQDGAATNSSAVFVGGTRLPVLNQLSGIGSLDNGVATNLGVLLRGQALRVGAQNVGVVIGGVGLNAAMTNAVTYTFQRSHDAENWVTWTNVAIIANGTNRVTTNFVLNLGDWQYLRVWQITNANFSGWRSNYLAVAWKQ